ncbi:hypothetical protein ACPXB3_21375 [Gordonia sp. DT219]|uniref:hypothetical protein n=1 Tax=Gordonia sp. DT219 TaxID=3416658 RepID=UPI003CF3DA10
MKLHVVTGTQPNPETGELDELVDEWESDQVTFLTEPSGSLVIFRSPNDQWAAYAPGHWMKIREA